MSQETTQLHQRSQTYNHTSKNRLPKSVIIENQHCFKVLIQDRSKEAPSVWKQGMSESCLLEFKYLHHRQSHKKVFHIKELF